jgi:hypothetical protein
MWPEAVIVSFLYCFGNYLHILEAVSKPRNGHFRWFSGDDQTRKTGHCVIAERPSKRLVNTPAMSFETDSKALSFGTYSSAGYLALYGSKYRLRSSASILDAPHRTAPPFWNLPQADALQDGGASPPDGARMCKSAAASKQLIRKILE